MEGFGAAARLGVAGPRGEELPLRQGKEEGSFSGGGRAHIAHVYERAPAACAEECVVLVVSRSWGNVLQEEPSSCLHWKDKRVRDCSVCAAKVAGHRFLCGTRQACCADLQELGDTSIWLTPNFSSVSVAEPSWLSIWALANHSNLWALAAKHDSECLVQSKKITAHTCYKLHVLSRSCTLVWFQHGGWWELSETLGT